MSVAESAKILGVTNKTITRWCESGRLPAMAKPYGKSFTYLISPQALEMLKNVEVQTVTAEAKTKTSLPHGFYLSEWQRAMASGSLTGKVYSKRTIVDYRYYADHFFKRHQRLDLEALKRELILIPAHNFCKREHYFKAMLCFARFLIREGLMDESFISQMKPLYPKRHLPPKRVYIDEPDLQKLLRACETPLDKLIITLLSATGLRASEACALTLPDIDLDKQVLTVRLGKGNKTRRVGLTGQLVQAIKDYLAWRCSEHKSLLVNRENKPIDKSGLFQRVQRIGKKVALIASCHALRRSFVTLNANKGYPLQMLQMACGHSDIQTTRSYCLTTEQEVIETMKQW